jgi:hypothetical protein
VIDLATRRIGEVVRAKRAFDAIAARDPFGRIKLGRELDAGNPYAHAKLARKGLVYRYGLIGDPATIDSAAELLRRKATS